MTKQELGLKSFSQRISTGLMTVDICRRSNFGDFPAELKNKLRYVQQLHKLFDYEFSKTTSDLELLEKITYLVTFYINTFIVEGEFNVYNTEIVPTPLKYSNFIVLANQNGGGVTPSPTTLLELDDTPDSYAQKAGSIVIVTDDESGVIFRALNTVINIELTNDQEEVVITWSEYLANHGLKPIMLALYERATVNTRKSTSPDYTEDGGVTYRWYVGTSSPRKWQVRIMGYVKDSSVIVPTNNLGFTYVFPAILQFNG